LIVASIDPCAQEPDFAPYCTMTTRKGSPKKGAPRHQNSKAFHHNKNSAKTRYIASLPNQGLCSHCHDIIEWKKKYRKYKPLTVPRRCTGCGEKTVRRAYHTLCDSCAKKRNVCAKCQKSKDIVEDVISESEKLKLDRDEERKLEKMSERQRRTYLRLKERGQDTSEIEAKAKQGEDDDDWDSLGDDEDVVDNSN